MNDPIGCKDHTYLIQIALKNLELHAQGFILQAKSDCLFPGTNIQNSNLIKKSTTWVDYPQKLPTHVLLKGILVVLFMAHPMIQYY